MKEDSTLDLLKHIGIKNKNITKATLSENALTFTTKKVDLKSPWILKYDDGSESVVLGKNELKYLSKIVNKLQEERLRFSLEKAIMQQMPIDFEDVWAVAMKEIDTKIKNAQSAHDAKPLDISNIVQSIKKSHPNLFFDIGDLLSGRLNF